MRDEAGFFTLDMDGIDDAFRAGGHLVIFCSPCNPLGRVFSADEMAALTEVVDRHGGRVFADEVHAPLVYPGDHAPPVRRHLRHRGRAHADRHVGVQGVEPARAEVRRGDPHQRGRPAALGRDGLLP